MSMIRRISAALIAVSALTVMAPGHAETPTKQGPQVSVQPAVNSKELICLAQNIYFEAGNETEEGKVAVGLVTLNRSQDSRFSGTVCGVVNQRTVTEIPRTVTTTKEVQIGIFAWNKKLITETQTIWTKLTVCQFSWKCMFVKKPKTDDERWVESRRVAENLLSDEDNYSDLREKYGDALYFHASSIKPVWAKTKKVVARLGGHIFYADRSYDK